MLDVNAGTALWLTQAVAPYMQERGSGAIVHVAARPGLEPTAGMATYSVSKAALVHLTRVLDLELRPLGIRVNAVAPQIIDTAKNRPYLPPELLAHSVSPAMHNAAFGAAHLDAVYLPFPAVGADDFHRFARAIRISGARASTG